MQPAQAQRRCQELARQGYGRILSDQTIIPIRLCILINQTRNPIAYPHQENQIPTHLQISVLFPLVEAGS